MPAKEPGRYDALLAVLEARTLWIASDDSPLAAKRLERALAACSLDELERLERLAYLDLEWVKRLKDAPPTRSSDHESAPRP